jgi:thiamine transport system substrate-binding protein
MKTKVFVILAVTAAIVLSACSGGTKQNPSNELVIYAYDSFLSEWGPGPVVFKKFEEATGAKITAKTAGDAISTLSKVLLEGKKTDADIVLGIDNNMLNQAAKSDFFLPYTPKGIVAIPQEFRMNASIIPFDLGYFSINYDSDKLAEVPSSLEDLTKKVYEKKLILMDPRTSSPGLGFFLWTVAEYGDKYLDYWKRLKPSILTISESWDSAYSIYLNGEAPLVLSYTTSPAYHKEYEQSLRYRNAVFASGHYMQIEGAGIVKFSDNQALAKKFIDFMISPDFQSAIPLTNWMYPVTREVLLPKSFDVAYAPDKKIMLESKVIADNEQKWLKAWVDLMRN